MKKSFEKKSLMCCSITPDPYKFEAKTPMGLITGHAYTVTKVFFKTPTLQLVFVSSKRTTLDFQVLQLSSGQKFVRVRNPWGDKQEWKGRWSDGSREWNKLSEMEKNKFGLTFDADGEWWMDFDDFLTNYNELEICHLCPEEMLGIQEDIGLAVQSWHGKWVKGKSAGGCR